MRHLKDFFSLFDTLILQSSHTRLIKKRLDGGITRLTLISASHVKARRRRPTCQNIDEIYPISDSDAFHFEAPRLSPLSPSAPHPSRTERVLPHSDDRQS